LTPEEIEAVKGKPFFKKILEEEIVLYEKESDYAPELEAFLQAKDETKRWGLYY